MLCDIIFNNYAYRNTTFLKVLLDAYESQKRRDDMRTFAGRKSLMMRIVKASLIVFFVFCFVLLLHLNDVRTLFFENAKATLERHMNSAEAIVDDNIVRMKNVSAECNEKVLNKKKAISINMVLEEETKDNPGFNFYYLDNNGKIYTPTITTRDSGLYRMVEESYRYRYFAEFFCTYRTHEYVDSTEVRMLGVRRNVKEDGTNEYLLVDYPIEELFESEVFFELTEISSCCIMDKDGKIVVCDDGFVRNLGEHTSFYDAIETYAEHSNEVKRKTAEMRKAISSGKEEPFSLSLSGDNDCFVVYRQIRAADDLYLVSCFDDEVLDSMVRAVMIRSFVTGLILFSIIVLILFGTWRRDVEVSSLVEKLAYEDNVTGGKNLNYFKDVAPEIISQSREHRFCIYRFDILRFRYINEAYGHIKADRVLMACIEEFKRIYGSKEICVRIHSDQFLALVSNDDNVDMRYHEYLKAVDSRARDFGVKYPIRFRVGIYKLHKEDTDIDIMIDHANVARKSLSGEEKVLQAVYSEKLLLGMRKVNEIESVMQQALVQGEFKIYLQPKWSISENRLVGAEALARWRRKDGTMIFPSEFIPIFEKNGFIEKLDLYMFEKLCMQMREFEREGIYNNVRISINQSRILILNPDYAKNIEKMIQRYDVPVENIEIEITETVFLDEKEQVIEIINRLKEFGVILAMDDFGSGYSSLNILKDVPFDVLKIDREFFSETNTSLTSVLILEKIIEMAKAMGISVVCEGVETAEQVDILRDIGCDLVQGYFYGRPMPIEEFYERYCRVEE